MAAFIGKWKQDEFDHEKFRDFIKASGASEDLLDKTRKGGITWEIKQEDKKWIMDIKTSNEPILTQYFEFTVGEPYESTDLFGRKFKMVTEVLSDTKMKDTCTEWGDSVIDIIREVKDDKLYYTATCKGVAMDMTFSKI